LGVSLDKDLYGICQALKTITSAVILTKAAHPRSRDLNCRELQTIFGDKPCKKTASVSEAITQAIRQAGKNEVILITGSLFVASEARRVLGRRIG
jgi:dihydrofolate synthase / folylpolyglutamate synthase